MVVIVFQVFSDSKINQKMGNSYIVLDNVLDQDSTTRLHESIDESTRNPFFYKLGQSHFYDDFSYAMLDVASHYFELKSCIGYEFWTRLNRCVGGWHRDKDEKLFDEQGIIKYTLCSIIYYPYIDNMKGGELLLESDVITPKTNRMVIFASGILHNVESFTGNRISMMVNAWDSYVSNN